MSDDCDSRLRGARLAIETVHRAGVWNEFGALDALVESCASAIAGAVDLPAKTVEVALALSDDTDVRELNRTFRHQDKPTNVLSFPAGEGVDEGGIFIGDIVLAEETLLNEAADLRIPAEHHFQHLVIHGILHLLGYDHEDDQEAEAMEALEISLLSGIGIPNPYSSPATEAGCESPECRTRQSTVR
ncbi:MAG: hypothetical protein RLZ98_447 [Pseudomonadota bacterium]|jgi:probable rRNA maturation factor